MYQTIKRYLGIVVSLTMVLTQGVPLGWTQAAVNPDEPASSLRATISLGEVPKDMGTEKEAISAGTPKDPTAIFLMDDGLKMTLASSGENSESGAVNEKGAANTDTVKSESAFQALAISDSMVKSYNSNLRYRSDREKVISALETQITNLERAIQTGNPYLSDITIVGQLGEDQKGRFVSVTDPVWFRYIEMNTDRATGKMNAAAVTDELVAAANISREEIVQLESSSLIFKMPEIRYYFNLQITAYAFSSDSTPSSSFLTYLSPQQPVLGDMVYINGNVHYSLNTNGSISGEITPRQIFDTLEISKLSQTAVVRRILSSSEEARKVRSLITSYVDNFLSEAAKKQQAIEAARVFEEAKETLLNSLDLNLDSAERQRLKNNIKEVHTQRFSNTPGDYVVTLTLFGNDYQFRGGKAMMLTQAILAAINLSIREGEKIENLELSPRAIPSIEDKSDGGSTLYTVKILAATKRYEFKVLSKNQVISVPSYQVFDFSWRILLKVDSDGWRTQFFYASDEHSPYRLEITKENRVIRIDVKTGENVDVFYRDSVILAIKDMVQRGEVPEGMTTLRLTKVFSKGVCTFISPSFCLGNFFLDFETEQAKYSYTIYYQHDKTELQLIKSPLNPLPPPVVAERVRVGDYNAQALTSLPFNIDVGATSAFVSFREDASPKRIRTAAMDVGISSLSSGTVYLYGDHGEIMPDQLVLALKAAKSTKVEVTVTDINGVTWTAKLDVGTAFKNYTLNLLNLEAGKTALSNQIVAISFTCRNGDSSDRKIELSIETPGMASVTPKVQGRSAVSQAVQIIEQAIRSGKVSADRTLSKLIDLGKGSFSKDSTYARLVPVVDPLNRYNTLQINTDFRHNSKDMDFSLKTDKNNSVFSTSSGIFSFEMGKAAIVEAQTVGPIKMTVEVTDADGRKISLNVSVTDQTKIFNLDLKTAGVDYRRISEIRILATRDLNNLRYSFIFRLLGPIELMPVLRL